MLYVDFDKPIGWISHRVTEEGPRDPSPIHLFQSNAYATGCKLYTDENGEQRWGLQFFFNDKDHAKRCLGLVKGFTRFSLFVVDIHFYENSKRTRELAGLFAQAYERINIYFGTPWDKHPEVMREGD